MALSAVRTSLTWDNDCPVVVDQRALPHEHRLVRLTSVDAVIEAITSLTVRGAPAIGLVGALGVALSARQHHRNGRTDAAAVRSDAARLARARPTAVNLAWGVRRALARVAEGPEAVLAEAMAMLDEDIATNQAAVARAAHLVSALTPFRPLRVLTHCNTGGLATAAVGTALGAILRLAEQGRIDQVLVGETRPLLQGARLTTWELGQAGVPYRLCVDSAAPAAMAQGLVDCVLVGADRVAANGDVANKIGTYSLAVAAARHGIPFIVVAPESSWDLTLEDGSGMVIEERDQAEVTSVAGTPTAPAEAPVYNPAFDVTPAELIAAIVTERQVFRPSAGPRQLSARGLPNAGKAVDEWLGSEIAALSRDLYERGWMPGTSGNLSARLPGTAGHALITASGRDKGELTARDMVAIDASTGIPVNAGGQRPSAEVSVHAAVYRTTNANAVVHVHCPCATAVASRSGALDRTVSLPIERFELLKGLGLDDPSRTVLPIFPNRADVSRIGGDVAEHLLATPDGPPALLIADHGITVWGRDLAQARNRLECLEAICRLLILTGTGITP